MLIRELETQTGLERATIRYYETLGFINPVRQENGYRTYSREDLDSLLRIKLLRQLGLSLEKIQEIRHGSVVLSDALSQQIETLEQQISDSRRAVDICTQIKSSGTSYENLDANRYLKEMAQKRSEQPVPEFRRIPPVHPWKRFIARRLDGAFLHLVFLLLLGVVLRIRPVNGFLYQLLDWYIVINLLLIPVEAMFLHLFGTTPGKFLLGIRVESENGGNLTFAEAAKRSWNVLRYGYGFCIPIYSVWRLYRSYRDYKELGYSEWELKQSWELQFDYYYPPKKKAIAIGIVVCMLAGLFLWIGESGKPTYRGENLTVAQVAENFNNWSNYHSNGTGAPMKEDGRWPVSWPTHGANIAFFSDAMGIPEDGYSAFVFETKDGDVRRVTFDETWTEIGMNAPMSGDILSMTLAILTAQDWYHAISVVTVLPELQQHFLKPQGDVTYGNIRILWSIETENCSSYQGVYHSTKEGQSRLTLHYEIHILADS